MVKRFSARHRTCSVPIKERYCSRTANTKNNNKVKIFQIYIHSINNCEGLLVYGFLLKMNMLHITRKLHEYKTFYITQV